MTSPSIYQFFQYEISRYKKHLKALFLVHPTTFIRIVWNIFKPFISFKFEKKVHYVNYLHELNTHIRIAQLNFPQVIIDHDMSLVSAAKNHPSFFGKPQSSEPPRPTQQFNVSLEL